MKTALLEHCTTHTHPGLSARVARLRLAELQNQGLVQIGGVAELPKTNSISPAQPTGKVGGLIQYQSLQILALLLLGVSVPHPTPIMALDPPRPEASSLLPLSPCGPFTSLFLLVRHLLSAGAPPPCLLSPCP